METEITASIPAYVYQDREMAQRERDRAQAHADLDVDVSDGYRYSYWIGEVRRTGLPEVAS